MGHLMTPGDINLLEVATAVLAAPDEAPGGVAHRHLPIRCAPIQPLFPLVQPAIEGFLSLLAE